MATQKQLKKQNWNALSAVMQEIWGKIGVVLEAKSKLTLDLDSTQQQRDAYLQKIASKADEKILKVVYTCFPGTQGVFDPGAFTAYLLSDEAKGWRTYWPEQSPVDQRWSQLNATLKENAAASQLLGYLEVLKF